MSVCASFWPAERDTRAPLTVNGTVAVQVRVPNHLVNLLVRVCLTPGDEHLAKLGGRDGAALVLVEDLERLEELLLRVLLRSVDRRRHELNEFCRRLR